MPADLYVTSPFMAGPHVLRVQEKLAALGYAPGPLDGLYGVATASAVIAFQRDHGLVTDGEIAGILRERGVLTDACANLVASANRNGGRDNITVVLIRIEEGTAPWVQPRAKRASRARSR